MLGPATAAMGPWASYGFDGRKIAATLKSPRDNVGCYQVEYGKEIAGVAVVVCPWLSGPYLQMLAVLPRYQKQGIGAAILAWYEAEGLRQFRNLWLCVSAFNIGAQRLYERHGYRRIAVLDGLIHDNVDEILMRKRVAPSIILEA
jgi:ribosomal protein S18 acetylase RimI-like enzyme